RKIIQMLETPLKDHRLIQHQRLLNKIFRPIIRLQGVPSIRERGRLSSRKLRRRPRTICAPVITGDGTNIILAIPKPDIDTISHRDLFSRDTRSTGSSHAGTADTDARSPADTLPRLTLFAIPPH